MNTVANTVGDMTETIVAVFGLLLWAGLTVALVFLFVALLFMVAGLLYRNGHDAARTDEPISEHRPICCNCKFQDGSFSESKTKGDA